MKKFLMILLLAAGAIVTAQQLVAIEATYEGNIAQINAAATQLGGITVFEIEKIPFEDLRNIMTNVREILEFETKSSAIVPSTTKRTLFKAVDTIDGTLKKLAEYQTKEARINYARNAIKPLESMLKTLKTGFFATKTSADLTKALSALTTAFINALKTLVPPVKEAPQISTENIEKFCDSLKLTTNAAKNSCKNYASQYLTEMQITQPGTDGWDALNKKYLNKSTPEDGTPADAFYVALYQDFKNRGAQ